MPMRARDMLPQKVRRGAPSISPCQKKEANAAPVRHKMVNILSSPGAGFIPSWLYPELAPGRSCQVDHIDPKRRAAYLEPVMALLPIITAPDPRLKIKARPVPAVDAKIRRLMDDMLETMYQAIGIGLAAPQVGQSSRVIVRDVAREGEKTKSLRLAK